MKTSWRKRAPKTHPDRQILKSRCGSKCFLQPKTLAFPVCPMRGTCKPTCQGLRAAYSRARQTHRATVARKALAVACRLRCPWTERHARCAR